MNRRSFLEILGLLAATAALDPEKLLWVPGEKTVFIPPLFSPLVYVNLSATRAGKIWHNGSNLSLIRVDQLDPVCRMSFELEEQRLINMARVYKIEPYSLVIKDEPTIIKHRMGHVSG